MQPLLNSCYLKHRYLKIVLKIRADCCGNLPLSLIIPVWVYFIIPVFPTSLHPFFLKIRIPKCLWNVMWNDANSLTNIKIFDIHCSSSIYNACCPVPKIRWVWHYLILADPCRLLLITLFSCRSLPNCLITYTSVFFLGAEVQLWIYKYPDPSIFCFQ